jgi:hypothetical protein
MESLALSGIFFLWIYFVCAREGRGRASGEGGDGLGVKIFLQIGCKWDPLWIVFPR